MNVKFVIGGLYVKMVRRMRAKTSTPYLQSVLLMHNLGFSGRGLDL